MAHIPIPNTVRVCLRYSRKGQTVCNVFHAEFPGPIQGTDMIALGAEIVTWYDTYVKGHVAADTVLQAVEIRDQSANAQNGIDYTVGLPKAGTSASPTLPNNVTVATKLTTGLAGRSFRGRWFWNGATTGWQGTNDTITSTVQTALNTALTELIDAVALAGAEMVIASLYSGGVPRTTGVTTPVTGVGTNLTLDSQRRRLPERGA